MVSLPGSCPLWVSSRIRAMALRLSARCQLRAREPLPEPTPGHSEATSAQGDQGASNGRNFPFC